MNKITKSEYATACEVHAQILNSAKAAQENLYQMAMGFKRMRDEKLYLQLGYQNFGDYCENETGFKRRHVYNYITICEKLPEEFVRSSAQLGVKKLELLTHISDEERTEIAETVDLESTTVRELKARIQELENAKNKAEEDFAEQKEKTLAMGRKNIEFVNKIRELESRPAEVVVKDNSAEIEELKTEYEAKISAKNRNIIALKERLEQRDGTAVSSAADNTYACFMAYMTNINDAWNRMLRYVNGLGYDKADYLALAFEATNKMKEGIENVSENKHARN